MEIYQDQTFEQVDFTQLTATPAEFEYCTFESCYFSESNLSSFIFSHCSFKSCDLSMIQVIKSAFRKVLFNECKLLGVDFSLCNPIGLELSFDQCFLQLANFSGLRLPGIRFNHCQMHEVQFINTNLQSALFTNCDLHLADFESANLKEADLSTAANFVIDPNQTKIQGAKFSLKNALNLLSHYQIEIVDL